jgi:carbonic anhydrase
MEECRVRTTDELLLQNKAWAKAKRERDPEYFQRMAEQQIPDILWIGCSDSRVPSELIVNAQPGEMFVHRNIANQIITTDFNSLSVIQFAVQVLKVRHIIVCGHYNCGGVRAALAQQRTDLALVNKWLMHVKDIYRLHQNDILKEATLEARINRLVELNVIEQVSKMVHTSIIQHAWKHGRQPLLHGWVYGLEDGILKELVTLAPGCPIDSIYQYVEA